MNESIDSYIILPLKFLFAMGLVPLEPSRNIGRGNEEM